MSILVPRCQPYLVVVFNLHFKRNHRNSDNPEGTQDFAAAMIQDPSEGVSGKPE